MRKLTILLILGLYFGGHAQATKAQQDSGWVDLFNGKDFTGLITFDENLGRNQNQGMFEVKAGGILQANRIGRIGWIMTEKDYSYYNVYVEYQFNASGNFGQNAGLLHHAVDSLPLFNGRWPQSQECQGQKSGAGDLWSIGLHVTTEVESGTRNYKPGGDTVSHSGIGGGTRRLVATDHLYQDNQWNTLEVAGRGHSYTHIVNGTPVLRGWNVRLNETDTKYITEGRFVLQQEGANVQYRNFRVQELDPQTMLPKFGAWGCTDPNASNHNDSAVMDDSSCVYIDGVKYSSLENQIDIHPSNGGIEVQIENQMKMEIRIFDFSGRQILKTENNKTSNLFVPIEASGVYFIQIRSGESILLNKRLAILHNE